MPLFQERIVQKYLKQVDEQEIEIAYDNFKTHYSPQRIQNIRTLKEEAFQEQFIKEIFGSVLGYSVYPDVPHNIEIEKKNESNAKKADGAIVKEKSVLGVIELKDNKTKNLDKVADQAFGYKHNHKDCSYVISSNFHKLRFYIDDATEYEEFDLYNLDKETFKRFYLYLRKEGLLDKNVPKLLRQETKFHEENITKKLYKDYSSFKNSFYSNIVKNNPEHDKLLLYKKAQKFLDRILFILFAEDKDLIPHNTVVKIVESWSEADDFHYLPLYEMLNILFGHLDKGHTYKDGTKIPAYNGGLFAEDEVLRGLKVDDKVLKDDLLTLSKYDFNTDVDVNILGHIFEHSLSEIEEVEATLRGEVADKNKGKRKKDGVFYTPKYITKYIVDNTIGKLCEDKKAELGLDKDFDVFDYQTKGGKLNAKGKELYGTIDAYRDWLLGLKILDPACGSGAFLNQALNFLIDEHNFIDDLVAELTNTPLRLFDTELAILENNIYGVDINEESIEIAKLSLWLRTAQPGRKLSNLNNNIKCGNSLIDDPLIAGDKAFKWEDEFPEVFAKGGFDVVIGNPPYVPLEELGEGDKNYIRNKFPQFSRKYDTSVVFKIKCIELTKNNGYVSFVTTITWQTGENYEDVRKFLFENVNLIELINLPFNVFADAYVDTGIFILRKQPFDRHYRICNFNKKAQITSLETLTFRTVNDQMYDEKTWKIVLNPDAQRILKRALTKHNSIPLGEISISTQGLAPSRFELKESPENGDFPYLLKGQVFQYLFSKEELAYTSMNDKENLKRFYEAGPKILFRRLINRQDRLTVGYNDEKCVFKKDINPFIIINENIHTKYALAILASKLISFMYVNTSSIATKDDFRQTTLSEIRQIPIVIGCEEVSDKLITLADLMIENSKLHHIMKEKFVSFIKKSMKINKASKKIEEWDNLEFATFVDELNKLILKEGRERLSKKEEMDWMDLFESKKKEVLELKAEIDKTDREIDQMVYELYGLSKEEIKIVEES